MLYYIMELLCSLLSSHHAPNIPTLIDTTIRNYIYPIIQVMLHFRLSALLFANWFSVFARAIIFLLIISHSPWINVTRFFLSSGVVCCWFTCLVHHKWNFTTFQFCVLWADRRIISFFLHLAVGSSPAHSFFASFRCSETNRCDCSWGVCRSRTKEKTVSIESKLKWLAHITSNDKITWRRQLYSVASTVTHIYCFYHSI